MAWADGMAWADSMAWVGSMAWADGMAWADSTSATDGVGQSRCGTLLGMAAVDATTPWEPIDPSAAVIDAPRWVGDVVYRLTLHTEGSGSIVSDPNYGVFNAGDVVTLTAPAEPGWTFAGWSGDLAGAANPESVTITGDIAITATWTQDDTTPPATAVDGLPAAQGDAVFTVSWSGSDAESGLACYDVQVRDGHYGTWTDWQSCVVTTLAAFTGTAGHTYFFRSSGLDNAGNQESYPSAPDYDTFTSVGIPSAVGVASFSGGPGPDAWWAAGIRVAAQIVLGGLCALCVVWVVVGSWLASRSLARVPRPRRRGTDSSALSPLPWPPC